MVVVLVVGRGVSTFLGLFSSALATSPESLAQFKLMYSAFSSKRQNTAEHCGGSIASDSSFSFVRVFFLFPPLFAFAVPMTLKNLTCRYSLCVSAGKHMPRFFGKYGLIKER